MKLEIIIKSARLKEFSEDDKEKQKEESEKRRLDRLLGNEPEEDGNDIMNSFNKLPLEMVYRPYVIETKDIVGFTPFDEEHTVLITIGHGDLILKMDFENWKITYGAITHKNIPSISDYIIQRPVKIKKTT